MERGVLYIIIKIINKRNIIFDKRKDNIKIMQRLSKNIALIGKCKYGESLEAIRKSVWRKNKWKESLVSKKFGVAVVWVSFELFDYNEVCACCCWFARHTLVQLVFFYWCFFYLINLLKYVNKLSIKGWIVMQFLWFYWLKA